MNQEIIKKINDIKDEYIIVGVSSGPDSMALLHMLINNVNKKIVCTHINHNVRKESKEEEQYLKSYCNKNNIIFEAMTIDSYKEKNFENEARKKRYIFYEKILNKYNSHTLLLAHHGDDLIETVLMKIIRGSNLEGYAGIKTYSKQKGYTIIRPLLNLTKEDIINYNKENNIKYYIDSTNINDKYTRNRLRLNILPLIKEENKNAHLKFLKYSNTLQEYYNYIEDITIEKINTLYNNNTINIETFNKEHQFMKKNIIFYILSKIYNDEANIIKDKHIDDILKLIESKKPNVFTNLPKNLIVKKEYNIIKFEFTKKEDNNYKIEFNNKIKIDNIIIEKIENIETDGNNVCRLNSKDISLPIYIRNKKNGDYIYLLGTNGKKKIKDIFIEEKIPLTKRNKYPIVTDANDNILWIPNIKKSKYNVKKEGLYDIILTSYEEREENNEE